MAKYNKKKKYNSRSNFNKIASKYSKDKFDITCRITLESGAFKFAEHNSNFYTIEDLLNDSSLYVSKSGNYQSMKVTGLAIEIYPMFPVSAETRVVSNGIYVLSYQTSDSNTSFAQVQECDKVILLNPFERVRKYWKFGDGLTGWLDSNSINEQPGRLILVSSNLPSQGGFYWVCRISLYVLFKNKVK